MSLVTVSQLTPLVPSPIDAAALQAVIDRVEADLTALVGAPYDGSALTETVTGGGEDVFLKRPIDSVSSVTEYALLSSTSGTVLVEGTTFYVWPDQGRLTRLGRSDGWGERVVVSYVPQDQRERRKQVIIDLVRVYLSRSALKSESISGSHSYNAPDNWEAEVRRVARRLQFTVV